MSATGRKLAEIIWKIFVKGEDYKPPSEYLFLDQKRKMMLVKRIKRHIAKFELTPKEVGFDNTLNMC